MEQRYGELSGQVGGLIAEYGMSVVGAIVILIVGWIAAGWIRRAVPKLLARTGRVDATLQHFFGSLAYYLVLGFVVIAVLAEFGVQTASIIAVFGAIGLAIGLALQGTLSNVAAGVMLLLFRPFKVGDFVDTAGVAGTVKAITLFTTELDTPDNVRIIVANADVWGSSVKNFSYHDTRRVDLVVGIGYGDSMDEAVAVLNEVVSADERSLADPAPAIMVSELADSSVNITIRVWSKAGDYWPLKFALTKAIKEAFDAKGISIPYPQQDVHLHKVGAES